MRLCCFRSLPLLVLAVLGLPGSRALGQNEAQAPPRRVAFLVGINEYRKFGFTKLKWAEADVTALAAELKRLGFDEVVVMKGSDNISRLLTPGEKEPVTFADIRPTNEDGLVPTRRQILARLKGLLAGVKATDVVLVALSGHGLQLETQRDDGARREDGFFCPVDAVSNDPKTLISISELTDEILRPLGGRNLVLLDACRDNPEEKRNRGVRTRGIQGRVVALPEDTAILFACRASQTSEERDDLGHSVFTAGVLEALGAGGEITWGSLVDRVQGRVQQLSPAQEPISAGTIPRVLLGNNVARVVGIRAGEERDDNLLEMKFCWCPPGRFRMGSTADERGHYEGEGPVDVRLTRGFWMGKSEVTQSQWRRLMGSMPSHELDKGQGDNYPIYYVSHDDAVAFCRKLTEAEHDSGRLPSGWEYRLPTEAQWEYACRAGTTTAFAFGDRLSSAEANITFAFNAVEKGPDLIRTEERVPYLDKTAEVGSYRPNAWGLYDTHGNVGEWCADWCGEQLAGGDDPVGPATGRDRVIRGGGWNLPGGCCRSGHRHLSAPDSRSNDLGFRVARVPSGG